MSQILADLFANGTGVITSILGGNNITVNTVGTVATVNVSGTTNHAVQVGNALGALTSLPLGTAGQVLTSSGAGADPVWAGAGAAAIEFIKGNDGVQEAPIANVFALLTKNSTVQFIGSAGTETVDFQQTSNLVLGSSLPSLAGAISNTGVGYRVLDAITSGNANTALGYTAGVKVTSGASNTMIGYLSGDFITTGSDNVLLGELSGSAYTTESNNVAISNSGVVADSGVIRIGRAGTQTKAFIVGIDGVNVGSVARVVTEASDQLGTAIITAGAGIVITPGANTITISTVGGGLTWSIITANQTAVIDNGYFCNKTGTLALALPAVSAIGDVIEVTNENTATGVQLTQAAGQQILIGNTNTTLGATGTLTSVEVGDTLKIVCKVANTIWRTTSMIGNWTAV